MRIACASLLAAVLFTSVAAAQAIDPALQHAIDTRGAARAAGNAEEWGRHVTDDYLLVNPDGSVMNKMQSMAGIRAGDRTISHPRPMELNVRTWGNAAIQTFRDNALGFPARYTSVWVKMDNRWLCAQVTVTPVENQ